MDEPILTPKLEALIAEFTRSGVREIHIRSPALELLLSNDPAAGTVATEVGPPPKAVPGREEAVPPALPAVSSEADLPGGATIVRAPNLGTFYRAPKPGAPVYVELGAAIAPGAELCLIEVMKLFTAVRAEVGGRVHAILAEDGTTVEAGQPLFAILGDA